MSASVRKGILFITDFDRQYRWYDREAGWEIAQRFLDAVDLTLIHLGRNPQIGRERRFRDARLRGLRSLRVRPPFNKLLIFYRFDGQTVEAWRLMHGARDLSRRLAEPSE